MVRTNDQGRTPETGARYDAEMAAYQGNKPKPAVTRNIALMKKWAREGK
jgi:hypothetical protein